MKPLLTPDNLVRGRVRVYQVEPSRHQLFAHHHDWPPGWTPTSPWKYNTVLYDWATIVGKLLTRQGTQYGIGGMYLEFENTASPGNPVTPPTLTRGPNSGSAYYNSLELVPNRDYLRVPLIAGTLDTSDATLFPGGNVPTFFAQTSGVVGVHGRPFGALNNSTVFGGALVATVSETDATQDLVFSRFYLDVVDQKVKLDAAQIGLQWELPLG